MVERIAPAVAWIGYGYDRLRRSLDAGKKTREAEEVETQKALEEQSKTIQPIYNVKGKLIEYDNSGRHLNILG